MLRRMHISVSRGVCQLCHGEGIVIILLDKRGAFASLQVFPRQSPSKLPKPGAAAKALKGAAFAVAGGTVGGKSPMTDLTCHAGGATVQSAVQDQARAKSRTKGHKRHILCAAACSVHPFRQGAGIGIVAKRGGQFQLFLQQGCNGDVFPVGEIRGSHDHAATFVQGTTAADADRGGSICHPLRFGKNSFQRFVAGRGFKTHFFHDLSCGVTADHRAFGAANVNSDQCFQGKCLLYTFFLIILARSASLRNAYYRINTLKLQILLEIVAFLC